MKRIIGAKFHSIHRVLDMLCLNFGNDVQEKDGNTIPEYSLHIQSQWRFVKGEAIIVASRDVYIPNNPQGVDDEWEYDLVGCPDDQSSIFDVVTKDFAKEFGNATVKNVDFNVFGDLKIEFSNGIIFETFTPSARKDEEWRFMSVYEDEHFVVFDI